MKSKYPIFLSLFFIGLSLSTIAQPHRVFFTQYFEGVGDLRALEFTNYDPSSIQLSRLRIKVYLDGNIIPDIIYTLSIADDGITTTVARGGENSFLVYNSNGFNMPVTQLPQSASSRRIANNSVTSFDGNDAIELQYDTSGNGTWVTTDIFGCIGTNPGVCWSSGGIQTIDISIERSMYPPVVYTGVTVNPVVFDPSLEWRHYPRNNNMVPPIIHLGTYTEFPLPISLLSFNAKQLADKVQLNWTTINETNNSHFNVERSVDEKEFVSIAKIEGAGNSNEILNYAFVDKKPPKRVLYYRLRQTDFDGTSTVSKIIAVHIEEAKFEIINIKPMDNMLSLEIYSPVNTSSQVMIIDITGRILAKRIITLSEGFNSHIITIENLSPGIHLINLLSDENAISKKFIFEP